jgi:hypothetical protein
MYVARQPAAKLAASRKSLIVSVLAVGSMVQKAAKIGPLVHFGTQPKLYWEIAIFLESHRIVSAI